jgi:hypothetical protein
MSSRPHILLKRDPGVLAPSFTARRLGTSTDRDPAPWRVVRHKTSHVQTPAALDSVAALPVVRRVRDSNKRWRVRAIPTWMSYVVRLITFNLTVVSIHLAVLRWIFLPIGG